MIKILLQLLKNLEAKKPSNKENFKSIIKKDLLQGLLFYFWKHSSDNKYIQIEQLQQLHE